MNLVVFHSWENPEHTIPLCPTRIVTIAGNQQRAQVVVDDGEATNSQFEIVESQPLAVELWNLALQGRTGHPVEAGEGRLAQELGRRERHPPARRRFQLVSVDGVSEELRVDTDAGR